MTNANLAADFRLRLPPLALPPEILAAIRAGAWIVFNVSGGKDSSAAMFTTNIVLDQLGRPDHRLWSREALRDAHLPLTEFYARISAAVARARAFRFRPSRAASYAWE